LVWKIEVCKHVGVMHVLSMVMGFDMGSFLIGHILDNHNHGTSNSQVSKYRVPKPYKVTIFKCGPSVEKRWATWKYKQNPHWTCIYPTCTCSWIPRKWMRWFAYPGRMEDFSKCIYTQKKEKAQPLGTILGVFGRCHIPCLCYLLSTNFISHK